MKGLFITGTDTEVGKTVVTAAIADALRRRGFDVGVMKPVATGCLKKNGVLISQDAQLLAAAAQVKDSHESISPYRFEPPVAPLVALLRRRRIRLRRRQTSSVRAELVEARTVSLDRIEESLKDLADRHEIVLIEGIGGLLVPLDAEKSVLDLAKRLRLPVLIVARAGLGTINHTLLTLEAARSAGLSIAGVVFNGRSGKPTLAEKTNPEIIRKLGAVPILGQIPQLAMPTPLKAARHLKMDQILRAIRGEQKRFSAKEIRRLSRLDREKIWHPFTQMQDWEKEEPLIVASADGVYVTDTRGRRYLDGVSSLWVNLHGHRHPALDAALRRQLEKAAHTTLLGCGSVPSIELAAELLKAAPKNLSRIFYSDSGSTSVEIALKMAFQYCRQNGWPRRTKFVHFVNAYHGDTIGSVSVGGIDLFHQVYGSLLFKGFKVPAPYPYRGVSGGQSLKVLEKTLRKNHRRIAALIVEPLVQGASGMILQPRGWLKKAEQLCRKYGIFLIADEVAVGFGRTGTLFACAQERVRPDFLCLAKGISGGYLPLAATLTTEKIYRGFLGDHASFRTFFHGHSYTGNALACAVGLENLKIFRRENVIRKLQPKIRVLADELERFKKNPHVGEVRQKGFMVGIELVADQKTKRPYPLEKKVGVRVCQELRSRGILLRPLGNVIVILPPLSISLKEIRFLCRETLAAIDGVTSERP